MTELVLVQCRTCEARVNATVRGELIGDTGSAPNRYVLLECPSCKDPILSYQDALYLTASNDIVWSSASRVYPLQRSLNPTIPEAVRRSFKEAYTCLEANALLACVVMCRKTIESLAVHQYGKVKNLSEAIHRLHTDRIIDERLYEWANALRTTGNLAAHVPEAVVSSEDARDLIDFTDAILQYVYVLRDRFEKYKARTNKAKSSASGEQR